MIATGAWTWTAGVGATNTNPEAGCSLPERTCILPIPAVFACQVKLADDCPLAMVIDFVPLGVSTCSTRSLDASTGWFAAFFNVTV